MALVAVGAVVGEGPRHSQRPILSPRGLPSCPEYLCLRSSQEGVAGPPLMRGTLLPRSPFPMGLGIPVGRGAAAPSLPQWPHCSSKGFPLPTGWSPSSWDHVSACRYPPSHSQSL